MRLLSDSFSADGMIPSRYTCDGENISPALKWNDVPLETQSLALIVDDPDAPGTIFVHWVVYDLSPKTREIAEDVTPGESLLEGRGTQGRNGFGNLGYGGPCPPDGIHRYFFKLYALDGPLGLAAGATKQEVEAAMEGHILAHSELTGRYERIGEHKHQKNKL
ncbi:YbhB/YbcL family Raf kinase inhibitor-like protein [Myxosarcina sp. GI1(2024)]